MANTKLALMALSKGVDQIPDHIIETIPIYRPPKEVRHQRRREQREQEDPSSQSDSKRSPPRKPKSSDRRYPDGSEQKRNSTSSASGNSNKTATDQSDRSRQEAEPDRQYYKDSKNYGFDEEAGYKRGFEQPDYQQEQEPPAYVPNRYIPPGAPPDINDYPPVEPPPPPPMGDNYYAPTRDDYSNRRYNPQDYAPQDGYGGGQQQYLQAPARYRPQDQRAHSAGPRYDDTYDDDESFDSRGRDSDRKGKHNKQRSRSRSHGAQHVLHRNFDTTDKGMAYGALGAIAGGAIGHHFGKGPLATVAGAVVGGLGANALEARHERRKSGKLEGAHKLRSRSTDYAGSRGDDSIDGTTRRDLEYYGSRRDRGYDDYSDEDDDRPRRRSSQRRRKSRGADEDDRRTLSTYENHH